MSTLTYRQYSDLVTRWNRLSNRHHRVGARDACMRDGHVWAVSPMTTKNGERVLVCTRCLAYADDVGVCPGYRG